MNNFFLNNLLFALASHKKNVLIATILVLVLVFAAVAGIYILKSPNNNTKVELINSDSRTEVASPKAVVTINKEVFFPIKNDKGVEVGKIQYNLESAELRDQIIVKGQKATTTKGRTFLIFIIKIKNELNNKLQINTRDYVRLSVAGNDKEWLAADIHSDPVEAQAISTKYARVGFPVSDTETNFKLQIGEINGPKEVIEVNFVR